VIKRGEIWWANLDIPSGSEAGFRRPVLIVQSDTLNESTGPTVVVLPLTSNTKYADLAGNVFLPSGTAGLPRDSAVNTRLIISVDRARLLSPLGALPEEKMMEVEDGLREILDLRMFPDA
jgi:mRNA interferase MazF